MNKEEVKQVLKENRLWAKKKFGQNFLLDTRIIADIINSTRIIAEDMVVEIGPGLGVLTEALAKKAKLVLAIEKDRDMVEYLRKRFKTCKNVKIICGNALFFDEQSIGLDPRCRSAPVGASDSRMTNRYKVIANLPYNITSPIIRKFLQSGNKPSEMVLMMQKEVAQRITAKPGSSERGLLTLIVEAYSNAQIVQFVPKEAFFPIPKVESAVVKFKVEKEKLKIKEKDSKLFLSLIKIGFSQKRRQIHHPLAAGLHLSKNQTFDLLKNARINPNLRAQDLSFNDWTNLFELVS